MATRPTPHSIALCALIALHNQPNSVLYQTEDESIAGKVDSFLQDCLLKGPAPWYCLHDIPIGTFLQQLSQATHLTIAGRFHEWMKVAASSLDALMDLMMTLRQAARDGLVDDTSANGLLLQSIGQGFEDLSFEETARLYEDFQREVDAASLEDDEATATAEESDDVEQRWTLSPAQVERSLRQECRTLVHQKNPSSWETVEMHLKRLAEFNPELPSAHFLRFLHCLQEGERVGAMEALHQYLDLALLQQEHRDDILQFAAILKAALHHSMGDRLLSLAATEEAVRIAQQSQDAACVAFALGWLFINHQNNHTSYSQNSEELIQRCVQRATEGHLRPLVAGANFLLAMSEETSHPSATTWTRWQDALADPPTAQASSPWDRPTHLTHLESGDQVLEIMARQRLVAAGIWDRLGEAALSRVSGLAALQSAPTGPIRAQDIQVALANLARSALLGSFHLSLSDASVPPSLPARPVHRPKSAEGLMSSNIYSLTLQHMLDLRQAYQLPPLQTFHFEVALVLHEWAVRRHDLLDAEALLVAMQSHLHPAVANYEDLVIDVGLQSCLLVSRQGRWDQAIDLCKKLIDECQGQQRRQQSARLLILLALFHLESTPHQKTNALPSLVECLAMTRTQQMNSLHATALSVLAQVHLDMGQVERAMGLLRASLPSILRQEHVWFQAEAYLTLSKCYLRQAKQQATSEVPGKLEKSLNLACQYLERSRDLFISCQDCQRLREVFYLLARVSRSRPHGEHNSDLAAQNFVLVSKYLQSSSASYTLSMLSGCSSQTLLKKCISRPPPIDFVFSSAIQRA